MRKAVVVLFVFCAMRAHAQGRVTFDDVLRNAEAKLKNGQAADARHMAITLANTALRDLHGADARHPLQRAALIHAYADRALQQFSESEWYWYVAKTLSISDDEMKLDGPFPMIPAELHRTVKHVGGEIKAPVLTHRVEPIYPNASRMSRTEKKIILELLITDHGVCRQPVVVSTDRDAALEYSAMEAVGQWQFKPGTLDDKPVPVLFNLTINFKLETSPPPPPATTATAPPTH
jgi:TonB family protein